MTLLRMYLLSPIFPVVLVLSCRYKAITSGKWVLIDADEQDLVFLHSGKGSIPNITNHKKSVLTHLKNKFDVDFFFDDTPEFREAAKSLFIPGVYPSIAAYTGKEGRSKKTRSNPHSSSPNCGCGKDPCVTYGVAPQQTHHQCLARREPRTVACAKNQWTST